MRLFKEQMTKADISPTTRLTRNAGVDLEKLEVVKCFEISIILSQGDKESIIMRRNFSLCL